MEIKATRREIISTINIIVSFTVLYIVIFISSSITIHIIAFIAFSIIAMSCVKFDILHPYTWLTAFFCIYSIGYPILYMLGFSRVAYSKDIMLYQLLGLFVILLTVTPRKELIAEDIANRKLRINVGILNKLTYSFVGVGILFTALYVYLAGFSGKGEMYNAGSGLLTFALRLPLVLSMLYTVISVSYFAENKRLNLKQVLAVTAILVIMTLFSGERDFIFRFLLINFLMLFFFGLLKVKHILVLTPLFVFLIPLSSTFKYYFLSGTVNANTNGIIYSLLNGEFESSARNLQVVVNNSSMTKGVLGYKQLIFDFISVFNSGLDSPSSWFTKTFYPTSQTQYGFSLIGEGYVIGGVCGIIVLSIVVGLIIKCLYKISGRNIYTISSYFYFVTVTIYSIRADLGIILSALVKQIGLVVLIIYILEKATKRNVKSIRL